MQLEEEDIPWGKLRARRYQNNPNETLKARSEIPEFRLQKKQLDQLL